MDYTESKENLLTEEFVKFRGMEVKLLEIQPDDIILVDFTKCHEKATDYAYAQFKEVFPKHKVLFIGSGMEIGLIRKS